MKRLCKGLVQSVIALLVFGLFAPSSQATTVVMLSDTELAVTSRFIVTGKVRTIFSAWDDAHTMIWTYVEVSRDRALKGYLSNDTIVLKQPGGSVGQTGMHIFGQPRFLPGQEVLLYLSTAPDGTLRVAHSFMGMFSVEDDPTTGEKIVTRSDYESEVQVLARRDNETVTDRAPLGEYIRGIEEVLKSKAALVAQIDAERSRQPVQTIPFEYQAKKMGSSDFTLNFAFFSSAIRWMEPDSGKPVSFQVNPNKSPVGGGASAELERAMSAWHLQSGANIRIVASGQTSRCGSERDGVNVISFGDCKNQMDPATGCSGVLAQATVSWTSETKVVGGTTFKRIVESDIVFNKGMDCFLATSANLAEVACHELGHAIGLGHSSDNSAIMRPFVHGSGRDANLHDDDISGVFAIYPSAGGPLATPVVTKVKIKKSKKLLVFGDNLSMNSLIVLNGQVVFPKSYDSALRRLLYKGVLNLNPEGANTVAVINGNKTSATFVF